MKELIEKIIKTLLLVILSINIFFMDKTQHENLLGKHISVAKELLSGDFKKNDSNIEFYNVVDSTYHDFYGMASNHITILTNESDTIQSVSIHFHKVLNRYFYDSFNQVYGKPNSILIIENRKIINETITKDENGNITESLRKGESDLREGSFEEKPLFIIWNKADYQIKGFLRHEQNISEITFSLFKDKL